MNSYIIFTFAIYGIGGTQIYTRNKMRFMQKHGWKTCVVTTEPGCDLIVKDLAPFREGVFQQLINNPYIYSKKQRNAIISNVLAYLHTFIADSENVVIESNFLAITPWAELIAERLKAKHFVFLIQEDYRVNAPKLLDFLYFKFKRGELAGNTPKALDILFDGYKKVETRPEHTMLAFCSNAVEDCESLFTDELPHADFNIGSIGRLNKPFVRPMLLQLADYASRHNESTFNLVLFGSSPDHTDIEAIKSIASMAPNLNLIITGPVFPIPLCDIKKMNLFISSAGAAYSSSNAGVVTIAIDALDFQPIGLVEITTDNIIHRTDEPIIPLSELLDEILIENKYQGLLKEQLRTPDKTFRKASSFILKPMDSINYYNIKKMAPHFTTRLFYRSGLKKFLRGFLKNK